MAEKMNYFLEDWAFTTEAINFMCGWGCKPPRACAFDPKTTRQYCCDTTFDMQGPSCWSIPAKTLDSQNELSCARDNANWTCVAGSETCDQTGNNNCQSTDSNPLGRIDPAALWDTYSSLSAANPHETLLRFDPMSLIEKDSSPMTSSMITTKSPATKSTSTSTILRTDGLVKVTETVMVTSAPELHHANSSLSPGIIAVIVVGSIIAFALGIVAWLLHRKKRQNSNYIQPPMAFLPSPPESLQAPNGTLPPNQYANPSATTAHREIESGEAISVPVQRWEIGGTELRQELRGKDFW